MKPDGLTQQEWEEKLEEVKNNPLAAFENGDRE